MKLENIKIVLVETTHPGNIGAAARAMKNMGLSQLVLVNPRCAVDNQAYARASGADDLLNQLVKHETLTAAVADCVLVVGTTARTRSLVWPALTPNSLAKKLAETADDHPVAVVFGREDSGLTNEELQHCHYSVTIPTNPDFSSLNVAAAIQVISYEIFSQLQDNTDQPAPGLSRLESPADSEQLEGLFEHLQRLLIDIDFLDQDNPRQIMKRLRRLYQRAEPTVNEVNILRGILSSVEKMQEYPDNDESTTKGTKSTK